jgi:hypothetical protein
MKHTNEMSLPKVRHARQIVRALLKSGAKFKAADLARQHDIGRRTFDAAIMLERERFAVLDELGVSHNSLTPTAQQRLDGVTRRVREELQATFERRVQEGIAEGVAKRDRLDVERIEQANAVLGRSAKRPFTALEFTSVIMRALHPDTSNAENRLEAFKLVSARKFLLREDGRIVTLTSQAAPLPKTPEEWAAAKARASAERKAKRAGAPA